MGIKKIILGLGLLVSSSSVFSGAIDFMPDGFSSLGKSSIDSSISAFSHRELDDGISIPSKYDCLYCKPEGSKKVAVFIDYSNETIATLVNLGGKGEIKFLAKVQSQSKLRPMNIENMWSLLDSANVPGYRLTALSNGTFFGVNSSYASSSYSYKEENFIFNGSDENNDIPKRILGIKSDCSYPEGVIAPCGLVLNYNSNNKSSYNSGFDSYIVGDAPSFSSNLKRKSLLFIGRTVMGISQSGKYAVIVNMRNSLTSTSLSALSEFGIPDSNQIILDGSGSTQFTSEQARMCGFSGLGLECDFRDLATFIGVFDPEE